MKRYKGKGKVEGGKLLKYDVERFQKYLAENEGKYVYFTVSEDKPQRSNPQNRYYRGVVVPIIADFMGESTDYVHGILAHMFLKVIDDRGFERVRSTADLNTTEFEQYTENCRRFGMAEFGLHIPLPNEAPESLYEELARMI